MIKALSDTKIGKNSLQKFLITGLVFFALLTPADSLRLKLAFLILLLIFNGLTLIKFYQKKSNLFLTFYTFILPAFLICISFLLVGNLGTVIKYFYVFIYLTLIPIVEKNKANFTKIVLSVINILVFIINISVLLDIVGVMSIYTNPVLQFLNNNGEAQISLSVNAIFKYVVFLNASPLILISFCYYMKEHKWFMAAMSFLALVFSGTRANIYLTIVALVLLLLFDKKNQLVKPFLLAGFFLVVIFFGSEFLQRVDTINSAKSIGDDIRVLNMEGIIKQLNENPISYIIGNGAQSSYYSFGRMDYVVTSELSYMELLRQTGLLGTIPFLIFVFKPLFYFFKRSSYRWLFVTYGFYLIKCIFDPFLFTSTGFIFYVFAYLEMRKGQQNDLLSVKISE